MTDCILVGNGTSLLERDNGSLIDAHRIVCRFNEVSIAGYEKQVGAKTDIWFTCLKYSAEKFGHLRPCRRIVAHSWQRDPDKCKTYQGYKWFAGAAKLDHALIDEMCDQVQRKDYRTWSTGALAIWMMLKEHERVTITGFDWWERGPEQHHYADRAVRGTLHKPEREHQFIEKLVSQGKVNLL